MTDLPLFDEAASRQARDVGVARAGQGAGENWLSHALDAIRSAAMDARKLDGRFTSDDVYARLKWHPKDNRAMGVAMLRAQKLGIMVPTSNFVSSTRPSKHSCPARIWMSTGVTA